MKKMAMVLVCVMVLSGMAMVNQSAATTANPDWYNCALQSSGALTQFFFVFATCAGVGGGGAWADSRVFLIDSVSPVGKALLAASLTAFASGGQAALFIPGFTAVPTGPTAGSFVQGVGAGAVQ